MIKKYINKQHFLHQVIKKIGIIIIQLFLPNMILCAHSLIELAEKALENNSDIFSANNSYHTAIISTKTMNGAFSPQLTFSSSTQIPKDYSWKSCPDYLSSSISYTQPLPGGSSISISGGASVNTEILFEELHLSQNPNLSISLQQSLMPHWIQGKFTDPNIENVHQQKQYYYNELLNTKKSIIINVVQNFVNILIYKKQIQISQNSISLLDEQIEAAEQLKSSGATSQSKITELLNSKWFSQQDLLNIQTSLESSIHNLEILCNCEIDISDINHIDSFSQFTDDIFDLLKDATDGISNPEEKNFQLQLEMLKNKMIINKQTFAPEISVSVKPSWSLGIKKKDEWKDAWNGITEPSNWSATVGINLSPFISASRMQNKKQYELDYKSIMKSYEAYLLKKTFIKKQYKNLTEQYKKQLEEITKISESQKKELLDVKKQYESGDVSKIDYDSVKIRTDNCNLNFQINELYLWLYDFLQKTEL